MTNATSQVFFHLESASTVTFPLLNYNNDIVIKYFVKNILLVVIKTRSNYFF